MRKESNIQTTSDTDLAIKAENDEIGEVWC